MYIISNAQSAVKEKARVLGGCRQWSYSLEVKAGFLWTLNTSEFVAKIQKFSSSLCW